MTTAGHYVRLSFLAAGLFIAATNSFLITGLLPDIAGDFGVHPGDVSLAITWYSGTVAVAAPALSMLAPRASRRALMAGGLVAIAIGTTAAALADGLPQFIGARVIAGLGAAALVPTVTASASALSTPEHRGRAIAFVLTGFTTALAFGAPLATALSASLGWHVPMLGLAVLALVVGAGIALTVRRVPLDPPVTLRQRLGALSDRRLLAVILGSVFVSAGFNTVYIFSSQITGSATGGDGGRFALLLLAFGVAGIAGNAIGGKLTDVLGSRIVGGAGLGTLVLLLALMPVGVSTFVTAMVMFALLGLTLNGQQPALAHRQLTVEPTVSGIAVAWGSTASYVGVAFAPPLGAAALAAGGSLLLSTVGAGLVAVSLALFLLSWVLKPR